ncbi:phage major tail tube protein [Diaphorobacter sp. HDW4A]|uniref:phage major tail tube protein n=1 Tax=Diaphorobacter sp. HDW4A TaxID=2714924 RepID=UPI00140D999D|nr:phage major tail tube protein [Diaphorobacter sp. HDW4A]QIL80811.1 phage major tail tube protein [Diaphorobacter sp. HDW4A]QIL83593.1 phage major tail tube protein [Diaphorobacter sp. HDW4A]
MALPRKLKNFVVFVNGTDYRGEVTEIVIPKLKRKMEGHRSGGMGGEVKLDFGVDGTLEMEIKGAGWMKGLASKWGSPLHNAELLRFVGAIQTDETGAVTAVEVTGRGRIEELDQGTAKAGDKLEPSYKYVLSYYKQVVDGKVEFEIDLVNMIEIVDGVDNMAATRTALGI